MWLPRLMRAATAQQEMQTSGDNNVAHSLSYDITEIERERLTALSLPAFRIAAPTNYKIFRHFFVFFGWCCVCAFGAFILLLVSYISRETKETTKDFSMMLVLTFFLIAVLIYAAFRHLKAQLAFWRNNREHSLRRCHGVTLSANFFFQPSSFSEIRSQPFSCQVPLGRMSARGGEFLVLPSYDDAIKESMFAPPPYDLASQDSTVVQGPNEAGSSSAVDASPIREVQSDNVTVKNFSN